MLFPLRRDLSSLPHSKYLVYSMVKSVSRTTPLPFRGLPSVVSRSESR